MIFLSSSFMIKKHRVERVESIKFLGDLLDENLYWKHHIKYTENKVAQNISLLYRTKLFLDKNSLLTLYYSYIHTYLNYENLSWGSTNRTNIKKLISQQKHAVRIIIKRTRLDHTNELFKTQKVLNPFSSVAVFIYQIRNKTAPLTFSGRFEKISMDTQQIFHNLTIKLLKPDLAKANSESHLEGPLSGITFSKILKKKLSQFHFLNLN